MIKWLRRERTLREKLLAGLALGAGLCALHVSLAILAPKIEKYLGAIGGPPLPTETGRCVCLLISDCGAVLIWMGAPTLERKGATFRIDKPICNARNTLAEQMAIIFVSMSLVFALSRTTRLE